MTKPTDQWMPLHISSYISDTMHLTTEQHGSYLLLLMHSWVHGSLPDDIKCLASITKVSPLKFEREVWPTLRPFFTLTESGRLIQKRLEFERQKAAKNVAQKVAAANARYSKNPNQETIEINADAAADADKPQGNRSDSATPPSLPLPEATLHKEICLPMVLVGKPSPSPLERAQDGSGQGTLLPTSTVVSMDTEATRFEEFYRLYPRKVAKPAAFKAYKKAVKVTSHAVILDGLTSFKWPADVQYHPYPATWLNNQRWTEAPKTEQPRGTSGVDPDPSDLWGITAFCTAHTEIKPSEPEDRPNGLWAYKNSLFDRVARLVARAAGFQLSRAIDWSPLMSWIDLGLSPTVQIVPTIERMVATFSEPPTSLRPFDKSIREKRAA